MHRNSENGFMVVISVYERYGAAQFLKLFPEISLNSTAVQYNLRVRYKSSKYGTSKSYTCLLDKHTH